MLARCVICSPDQQAVLDARLLAGEALLPLANEYGLHSRDLRHHREVHVLHLHREGRQRGQRTGSS